VQSRFIENSPPINLEATNPSFLRWFCPIDVVREKEIMGGAIKCISEVKWSWKYRFANRNDW
jgi:hypothetical protein